MFKIGEFSKLVRVSPRMLRHYEKCGLVNPARTDGNTGYRYYSADQIPLLARIAELRDMGCSVEEIGDILPQYDNPKSLDAFLRAKAASAQSAIDAENEKLACWMEANGYEFAGKLRGCTLAAPDEEPDPERWLVELQAPVRKVEA